MSATIVPHGTLDYEELAALGLTPDDLDVFSSNVNPYGPPPAVIEAVRAAVTQDALARYPDRAAIALRRALADHHAIAQDEILVGNGTADILWLIALLFVQHKRVAILSPTFGEYANTVALVGAHAAAIPLPGWEQTQEGEYTPANTTLATCIESLRGHMPEVVFLCNPNNPTGELLSPDAVRDLTRAAPHALWIVDEAYAAFTPTPWSATTVLRAPNVLVLHSMTKDFAMAGLRLGYVTGPASLIARMAVAQPPWNVNALAQVAGLAALGSLAWREETMARLRKETEELRGELRAAGFAPRPTTTNYFLVPVRDASELRRRLLARRIMVRDCTSFGLPGFIRIATQQPDANRRLVAAMTENRAEARA